MNLRLGEGPQELGSPAMVAVRMSQEDGPDSPPVQAQPGHLGPEGAGVLIEARIDQDQALRRLDHISGRGLQSPEHVHAGGEGHGLSAQPGDPGGQGDGPVMGLVSPIDPIRRSDGDNQDDPQDDLRSHALYPGSPRPDPLTSPAITILTRTSWACQGCVSLSRPHRAFRTENTLPPHLSGPFHNWL